MLIKIEINFLIMEDKNESYKEYAVRNSNIIFAGNKPIYVFYSEWNCKDSADHTGRATTVLIFVAAVLYIVYLVQTIVNIRKF